MLTPDSNYCLFLLQKGTLDTFMHEEISEQAKQQISHLNIFWVNDLVNTVSWGGGWVSNRTLGIMSQIVFLSLQVQRMAIFIYLHVYNS
jgi:hypothetical protein